MKPVPLVISSFFGHEGPSLEAVGGFGDCLADQQKERGGKGRARGSNTLCQRRKNHKDTELCSTHQPKKDGFIGTKGGGDRCCHLSGEEEDEECEC